VASLSSLSVSPAASPSGSQWKPAVGPFSRHGIVSNTGFSNVRSSAALRTGIVRATGDLIEASTSDANTAAEHLSPNFELLLMEKADELRDHLQGTCIFLIGMMDSGKIAIGKTLAKELGYYFFDSNDLVQQAAGGTDLSEDEEGYREAETEVLKQLSAVGRLVVSTGAGTVAKSENWGNLRHGIVVWIDMPLETVANCAKTRQLLVPNCADGDEALVKLSKLYEERIETYRNADAMVSIQAISAQLGIEDPATIPPSMTAREVLNVIGALIKEKQAKKLRL